MLPLLAALLESQPAAPGSAVEGNLDAALQALLPLVQPGSTVLLLSDFADAGEKTETLCAQLAAHGECRLFWITDPLEEQCLPDGRFRVGRPGRRARLVEGARLRESWLAAWREREASVQRLAERIVAPAARLDTAASAEETLRQLLPPRRYEA